jgi:hypothetical protein
MKPRASVSADARLFLCFSIVSDLLEVTRTKFYGSNGAHALTGLISQSDLGSQPNVAAMYISGTGILGLNGSSQFLFAPSHVVNGADVNTESGDLINVSISYDGSNLQASFFDTITLGSI